MSLFRTALRSNSTFSTFQKSDGFSLLRVTPWLSFSTEAQQPSQLPNPDSFPQHRPGFTYGRLLNIRNYTLKTDIIHLLKDCKLTMEDVKVEYSRFFFAQAMMLQFRSPADYGLATRVINRHSEIYKLERADPARWDFITPYDGKTIVMRGIPRNATVDEIGRFLSGCEYDQTSINFSSRQGDNVPYRMAIVRFRSRTEAMNAFITKNRTFCLNEKISIMILQ